jgi:hypothetical protein
LRGKHQRKRADQRQEKKQMILFGMLQRGRKLPAEPVDRIEQDEMIAMRPGGKPSQRRFNDVLQQFRQHRRNHGIRALHCMAIATWRICGGGRGACVGNPILPPPVESRSSKEAGMKILVWSFAAALTLTSLPALAGPPAGTDDPVVRTGARFCVGPGCGDRDDDWRWRRHHGYGWDRGGCRDVTVRERRDGEVVVRHIRRCD